MFRANYPSRALSPASKPVLCRLLNASRAVGDKSTGSQVSTDRRHANGRHGLRGSFLYRASTPTRTAGCFPVFGPKNPPKKKKKLDASCCGQYIAQCGRQVIHLVVIIKVPQQRETALPLILKEKGEERKENGKEGRKKLSNCTLNLSDL